MKDREKKRKGETLISILKLLFLFSLIIGIPVYIYVCHPGWLEQFNSLENVNAFLDRYQTASIFVYFGLQVIQIVISVLPGQALQFAAGYAYSFWLGYLYSIIGVALGTVITFYLARFLGQDAMRVILGEERLNRFVRLLNSKKAYMVLFIIYLIPGMPKDLLVYAAGISEMKITSFLIISLVGRTPAMMGSIMMGSMFYHESYTGLIILGIVAVIACVVGILHRDRLMHWADKTYAKMVK